MIVKTAPDEIDGYLRDASNMGGGEAVAVHFPESTQDVRELLAECSASATPVTVSGAGTGLSGARVPHGGVVLATDRLKQPPDIDIATSRAIVLPGVVLGDFQRDAEALDLLYPPDPTERTCSIGGTLATNASGARTFKYGPTRNFVEAIEVVLADGDVLELRRGRDVADGRHLELATLSGRRIAIDVPTYSLPPVKHAAGYYAAQDMDALDLFIGSEGTLGVITKAVVRLIPLPGRIFSGVVFFSDEENTVDFVEDARRASFSTRASGDVGVDARALEFIDALALDLIRPAWPAIPPNATGGAVWFEQEVGEDTEEKLMQDWYELMTRHDALSDESWFAIGLEDQRRLREFRHAVPSAVYEWVTAHGSTKIGSDMAVPNGRLRELLAFYRAELATSGLPNATWGHIGNNHLHTNILARDASEYARGRALYGRFVDKALDLGGTVSAEHGIGKLKKEYLLRMFGEHGITEMKNVKRALDPKWILGDGTMFDRSRP